MNKILRVGSHLRSQRRNVLVENFRTTASVPNVGRLDGGNHLSAESQARQYGEAQPVTGRWDEVKVHFHKVSLIGWRSIAHGEIDTVTEWKGFPKSHVLLRASADSGSR